VRAVPESRGRGSARHRAISAVALIVIANAVCGCSSGAVSLAPSAGRQSDSPLASFDACMAEAGFRVASTHDGYPGEPSWNEWESDLGDAEGLQRLTECQRLVPPPRQRSDEELTAIYWRWVEERACLVRLEYSPTQPSTVEKFISDWRSTGPWTPVDGIDITTWSSEEYDRAKAACTLEVLER